MFWPAKGGMGPESGAEPGVQHVLVLAQVCRATGRAGCRVFKLHNLGIAGVAVPDRDAVPPPELAADAPIAQVLHPILVDA